MGVGEVYAATFHPRVVERMIDDVFERHVAGTDPFRDRDALAPDVYARGYTGRPDVSLVGVLSGIEIACWDIVGKAVGKPVYELLGGRVHERLRAYTYLYTEPGDATDVYLDPALAAERAADVRGPGLHGAEVRPRRPVLGVRPAAARASRRSTDREAYVARDPRGGRRPLRPALRHARPVHAGGRDPPRATPRALRSRSGSRSPSRPRARRRWPRSPGRRRSRSRPGSG